MIMKVIAIIKEIDINILEFHIVDKNDQYKLILNRMTPRVERHEWHFNIIPFIFKLICCLYNYFRNNLILNKI
jgi:hypothetical protein